jgi:uncharacterized protein involved in type VI secretion and phage assembly
VRAGGPRIESADKSQFGIHYGVVTQNKDPNNLSRVKVRLPWLDAGDTDQSYWAQLMTPMEGKKFGWYTVPDINDVVAVMFIGGDSSQPVIVGGVWSTADFSPETNEDGKNNFRGYRSRSGHRMILDDSSKVKVVIADKTGLNMIGIGEFAKDGAGPNVCAVYKPPMAGDTGISISTMEGKMFITCKDGKFSITAKEAVKINTIETMEFKAGKDLTFEATSSAKVTSGDPNSFDGSKVNIA